MNRQIFDAAATVFPDACFREPPALGIVLGSGWGDSLRTDEVVARISYSDIPGLGASTVKGHAGEFVLYRRGGRLVAAWCGRRHWYEGAGWEPVVLPVEMLRRMGCQSTGNDGGQCKRQQREHCQQKQRAGQRGKVQRLGSQRHQSCRQRDAGGGEQ